ncbi:MAG TPA: ABC transporter permease [Bryobacteraceae bacterium]|jgi:predicted permease
MAARLREYLQRILAALRIRRIEDDSEAEFATRLAIPLESFFKDIAQGLRVMRTNPRFTLAAIAIVGISIGVNTTVVTLTNAALFKGYPQVQRNDRLLYLTMNPDCCVSYPTFEDWRAMARSFQGMAAVHDSRRTFSDGDDYNSARTYYATEITSNTFRLVERQPLLGRDFTHTDELPGAAPVVILSYRLWDHRYNRNPAILGHTVRLNGLTTTIIGVMPRGFSFPQNQDLWVPMVPTGILRDRSKGGGIWYILGRLADGVSAESARAEMQTIGQRLHALYPRTDSALPLVRTFPEFFIRAESIRVYQAMLGAVSFLLLIACANLANLLLARAIDRSRELSVRLALGAGRWRIIRQLLVESVLLSAPGGVLGWVIARYSIVLYANFADGAGLSSQTGVWFANILDYSMDGLVFAYLVAISLGTGVVFGLAPALKVAKLDIHHMLKDGGRGATGGGRGKRLSTALVMAEIALTVVLLAGSGVMIRSLLKIYTANLGFDPSRELMMTLLLPQSDTRPEMISFADRLKARLEAVPGVESVAVANTRPYLPFRNAAYETADAPSTPSDEGEQSRPKTSRTITTPDYFRSLGLSMVAGRDFSDADGSAGPPVVIVNRQFASSVWPHQNAIGNHLRLFEGNTAGPWLTVIGIAPDIAQGDFANRLYSFLPEVYVPYRQSPSNVLFIQALTRVSPATLANVFYRELRALDPALPLAIVPQSMAENLGQSRRYQDSISLLFLIFAVVALLLASVGLYSVVAHSVSRRTQEIGVRIALGATGARILSLISRQAIVPVGVGLAAGLAASLGVNRVLDTFIVGVSPSDPIALMGTIVVLILCAAFGCLIPARRAARIDPAQAIRYE